MVNQFVGLIVIAILVEAIINILFSIKSLINFDLWLEQVPVKLIFSIVLGVAFCFKVDVDILKIAFQVDSSQFGYAVTGILVSRGSNYVHELVKKITNNSK